MGQFGQADGGQPGLGRAEQVAGSADGEVGFGDGKAVGGLLEDLQAVEFFFGLLAGEQNAPRFFRAASDATEQLMQLGQPETFGVLNEQDGG
ncbi:MAG: hypothetical protein ACK56I_12435, partial [bacterium]